MERYQLYPIQYHDLYELYKKSRQSFWQPEEVILTKDVIEWEQLDKDTKHFISHILSFFAGMDGIIMKNIDVNFSNELKNVPEAKAFYAFQNGMEAIHNEMYGILLDTLIKDPSEKSRFQNGIQTIESVQKKARWAERWLNQELPFEQRLVAMACVEGILFSGSFCALFWLKQKGIMQGLTFSNELISRDEGLHTVFAITLFHSLKLQLDPSTLKSIVMEAVENEKEFIVEALPCKLIGMNSDLMSQYIEYVADYIVTMLGYEKIYNSSNPFSFMNLISLDGKTNFFERRVGEYSKSHETPEFSLEEEF